MRRQQVMLATLRLHAILGALPPKQKVAGAISTI